MQRALSEEVTGCTVGVVHIPDGILFFKNRDLAPQYLANRIIAFHSTPEVHTLKGVNFDTQGLEGISIGVNRHKVCVANTHIATTPDVPYDALCERLVNEAREKQDVPRIVQDFMEHNTVQGGRILVSAPNWTFLVEVLKEAYEMEEVEADFVMTNDFSLMSYKQDRPEIHAKSSAKRLQVARSMIQDVSSIKALKAMLRSHVPEKGALSICCHWPDGGGTESSHIIHIQGDYVGWSSLIGAPCENDYHTTQLFQTR